MSVDDLRVSSDRLRRVCSVKHFKFKTTEELPALQDIIGQPRGVRAIEFGIDIGSKGYNIYVLGPSGTGRTTAIQRFLQEKAETGQVPHDWVYVHNFAVPHKPRSLKLHPGMGAKLKAEMEALVVTLKREIPKAMETEEFHEEREKITHGFEEKRDETMNAFQSRIAEQKFTLMNTQSGLALIPLADGQPMSPEIYGQLPDDERKAIDDMRHELEHELEDVLREIGQAETSAREAIRELESATVGLLLDQYMTMLRDFCSDNNYALFWLDEVRADVLENLSDFLSSQDDKAEDAAKRQPNAEHPLRRYQVNLIVDHSSSQRAPVILLDLPTYQNLIGRMEAEVRFGAMTTDFTMIKAGALHQANGGYLVVRVSDILRQPFAWEGLKRALVSGEIRIEEPESRTGTAVMNPQTPEPEPIPLSIKVVLMGNPEYYYTLYRVDEDFRELFKVKADFTTTMERNHENEDAYALFIAGQCQRNNLLHFDPSGVGKVVEYGSWLSDDQDKLSSRFGEITDIVHESAFWARSEGKDVVSAEDVARAIDERVFRSNLIQERIQERIEQGKIFIDADGEVVGQINGLSVLSLGDYSFGQPSRVTARIYLGSEGVINIDREVEMAGPIHNKGLLILRGYLGGQYASTHPLSLTASLTFEQNYGGIDGDSASSTELYALLSALSGYAIQQSLAVTGSVNQFGSVQPIGGATQKIEGFYEVCKARGLTGNQGVMIPASNVSDLMLREEVMEAVESGKFHIYSIETIDQGIEVLTGVAAGERNADGTFPEGTVHHAVHARLAEMAEDLEKYAGYRQT